MPRPILAAESVTELGDDVRGAVLVAGSHGGLIAACLGARGGAHALILNDAGIGLDAAGIAGLAYLEAIGMAAATVSHLSARIGDGRDALARGRISHLNRCARDAGVMEGMAAREAAARLAAAAAPHSPPPPYAEGRWCVGVQSGIEVWALDSVGKLAPQDDGRILLVGSHGGLHGGRRESALDHAGRPIAAVVAVFNDAGEGADRAGITRLPELDRRGVAAATVAAHSARIGDGRSMFDSGVLSHANAQALARGARVGMQLRDWIAAL